MNTRTGSHYGEETIERYALGQLPEEFVPSFEEHILFCESCQARLQEVEQYISVVRAAASDLRNDARKVSWANIPRLAWLWNVPKPVWAGALAGLMVAVLLPYYHPGRSGTPAEVQLEAARGGDLTAAAHTKPGIVVLTAGSDELPVMASYKMEVVASNGREVWSGAVTPVAHRLRVRVPTPLDAGVYWVRVYGAGGALVREFGLTVE